MKLTVIGAGGVRMPMFVEGAAASARATGLTELHMTDVDAERLEAMTYLSRRVLARAGLRLKLRATTDARKALRGADFVVTTIRPGNERGRVIDERVAIDCGVIGQETTGPGGAAMAMRSVPAILDYARLIETVAPDAWIFNFTNPAGIVVQALQDAGFTRTIGICDSAENLKKYAAAHRGKTRDDYAGGVFGLNHLSFAASMVEGRRDVFAALMADDVFLDRYYGLFDKRWIRRMGLFPNEYLYYFAHTDHALHAMQTEAKTRGEQVAALNAGFFRAWRKLPRPIDADAALAAHHKVLGTRHESYMDYAWERTGGARPDLGHESEVEGYAGVMLKIMAAITTGKPIDMAVNVANRLPDGKPAIAGLAAHDVVEVSCTIDKRGAVPHAFPAPSPEAMALVQPVKLYERMLVHAIRSRRAADAVAALAAHPLVGSAEVAAKVFAGYRKRHGKALGTWR